MSRLVQWSLPHSIFNIQFIALNIHPVRLPNRNMEKVTCSQTKLIYQEQEHDSNSPTAVCSHHSMISTAYFHQMIAQLKVIVLQQQFLVAACNSIYMYRMAVCTCLENCMIIKKQINRGMKNCRVAVHNYVHFICNCYDCSGPSCLIDTMCTCLHKNDYFFHSQRIVILTTLVKGYPTPLQAVQW